MVDGVDPVGVVEIGADSLRDVVEHRQRLASVVDRAVDVVDLPGRRLDGVLGIGCDLVRLRLIDRGAVLPVRALVVFLRREAAGREDALIGVGADAGLLHLLGLIEHVGVVGHQ